MEKIHFLDRSITTREVIFVLALVVCATPIVSPPVALVAGLVIAQWVGHPYIHLNHKATHVLLQLAVIGLGFGMDIRTAVKAGEQGLLFTVVAITGTLLTGVLLGRLFRLDTKTAYLVSAGTAICGGSAIAALSPVIRAEEKQVSVAIGIIFILNSVALLLFPVVGHWLHLSQSQFGLWSAIAIHDTSSVVGAAGRYGSEALQIATAVKLARALWIIPVAFLSTLIFKNKGARPKIPWFIGGFVLAMIIHTYVPGMSTLDHYIVNGAHASLTLTLFLIGSGLSKKVLLSVGIRPMLQGVILWVMISVISLWVITIVV